MGHRHDKGEILNEALAAAVDDGLSQLTFGRLAKRLGISDRTIVYYFPSKSDLISEVLGAMGADLLGKLVTAIPDSVSDHTELLKSAWPVLSSAEVRPTFALFLEAMALASIGREPYDSIVPQLVEGWIDWTAGLIDAPDDIARAEAEAGIALVDGLMLLREVAGDDVADRAAARFGAI